MIDIIYEDSDVIAVNKPPGIVVYNESGVKEKQTCLSSLLIKTFPSLQGVGGERNGAVHRLDKDTSGVLLFAKNNTSLVFLQKQLLEKKAKKEYITLVYKKMNKERGTISSFIDRSPKDRRKQRAHFIKGKGRRAITSFKVIRKFEDFTLLKVIIKTGRKHQIRCHLSFIGHPIAGDTLYKFKDSKNLDLIKRQLLHARRLKIETPSGEKCFFAKTPSDFKKALMSLY